ncbi:MAG: PilC/PilY family type IV pilus protein, partial [Deltaproteobacteria bacterium]|nr:PilC/PilY family type IV pilus protein [Deltaproteobacteria bacterium]
YSGYYALNVTDTLNPQYLWRIGGGTLLNSSTQAPYIGDPWGKMIPGKVFINGQERWVGFVGAGYNATDCAGGGSCDSRGKGFFIVDLKDGVVLKSFTLADDAMMKFSFPATAAIVDWDNDGFIDTAYMGDLGGNLWRFKLCTKADGSSCSESSWQATLLYDSSSGVIRPIYTMPAAAVDGAGNSWIYWGTGDKSDPTAPNAQEKLYALKDNNRTRRSRRIWRRCLLYHVFTSGEQTLRTDGCCVPLWDTVHLWSRRISRGEKHGHRTGDRVVPRRIDRTGCLYLGYLCNHKQRRRRACTV